MENLSNLTAHEAHERWLLANEPDEETLKTRHAGTYVLLAEDEPINRKISKVKLENAGLCRIG